MRSSEPRVWIVFAKRHNSALNSIFTLQAKGCNFQYGPNFGVPSNPTFWFRCISVSWQSVLTTSHCICELWEICSIFRKEILSNFYNLVAQLDLCIFGALSPTRHSSNDRMSINGAKWTFCARRPCFIDHLSFLLLTFVRFHAEIFSKFSHSLSTAAFAAGIFMAWGIGNDLWTKF